MIHFQKGKEFHNTPQFKYGTPWRALNPIIHHLCSYLSITNILPIQKSTIYSTNVVHHDKLIEIKNLAQKKASNCQNYTTDGVTESVVEQLKVKDVFQ